MRLIVPPTYYSEVNKYVNGKNLRGRIRYDKYEEEDYLKNFQNKNINDNSLIKKINIKSKTSYYEWIESYLEAQFDFVCVDNLPEFERYSKMAITQNGLIKFRKGKHEKDDRKHISRRENYVLGWDNTEKVSALRKELKKQQGLQIKNKTAISDKKTEIKNLGIYRDECHNLFSKFDKYDDINWETYANQIQEKTEQKEDLEKTNDRVKKLQEQLKKVQDDLKQLSEVEIENKVIEKGKKQTEIDSVINSVNNNKAIFEHLSEIDVSEFEINNSDLEDIDYANFEIARKNFQNKNSDETSELNKQKQRNEREVVIKINAFKRPTETITNKFKDWRSDVNSLPDSTNLEFIGEYQKFLF